jgi:integrase/recombinase XerD
MPSNEDMQGGSPLQMKVGAWPETDQALWALAHGPIDILSDVPPRKEWRPATTKNVEKGYGRWLSWLLSADMLDGNIQPINRATKENIAAYTQELRATNSSQTIASYVLNLAMALQRMYPDRDLKWLWKIVGNLKRQAVPSRSKQERIVSVKALKELGFELMSMPNCNNALDASISFRDGLMIAILAARPIRIRNLHMIEIGKHLVKIGSLYYLHFEEEETKTSNEIDLPLPRAFVRVVDDYLEMYRPVLLDHAHTETTRMAAENALWITRFGTRMAEISIFKRISELTEKKFGRPVNPHLFRDCTATSIALDDPNYVYITKTLLGHTTMKTSERYYNHALSRKASILQQNTIRDLQREFRKAAAKPCSPSTRE